MLADYLDRVRHMIACEVVEVRDVTKRKSLRAADLIAAEERKIARYLPKYGRLVVLDERGTQFTSTDFAGWLESEQDSGTRLITFVIGGPEGLGAMITRRADLNLSLGKMTWTHEMCRVLLLEQLYRSFCILRRIPYHK